MADNNDDGAWRERQTGQQRLTPHDKCPVIDPTTRVKRFKLNIIYKSHTHTKKPIPPPPPPPPQSSTDLERTWSRSCSGRMSATPLATYDLSCSDDMLAVLVAISMTTKKTSNQQLINTQMENCLLYTTACPPCTQCQKECCAGSRPGI